MRGLVFAGRNFKEMLRDPMTLAFGMGLPVVLLVIMSLIARSAPVELFSIELLAPAMGVFSFSFITLFTALLMSKDRSGAFLVRLFATKMSAADFLLGYGLPVLPLGLLQGVVCYLAAVIMGLELSWGILLSFAVLLVAAVLYAACGMLLGAAFSDRQVGGFFSLFVNLSTWLSGTWFDPKLVGGGFMKVAEILPFYHCVEASRSALTLDFGGVLSHIWVVALWALAALIAAVLIFGRKMKNN